MRRSRVVSCLASSTQQMNSLRARGVMSFQASSAVALLMSAFRRSPGSLCTTPPGTREPLTKASYKDASVRKLRPHCASRAEWRRGGRLGDVRLSLSSRAVARSRSRDPVPRAACGTKPHEDSYRANQSLQEATRHLCHSGHPTVDSLSGLAERGACCRLSFGLPDRRPRRPPDSHRRSSSGSSSDRGRTLVPSTSPSSSYAVSS